MNYLVTSYLLLHLFPQVFLLNRNEFCKLENQTDGICIPLSACNHAKSLLKSKRRPLTCGFENDKPLVCCPLRGIKSIKRCAKYHDFDYTTETYVLAAVGGRDSLAGEYPFMAALGFGEDDNIKWNCGGSLISEEYVLTAAHCVYSRDLGFVKKVRLGDLNLNITTEESDPQDFKVIEYIRHPDYKPPSRYNDIALLKLESPVKFNLYIKPVCLETRENVPDVVFSAAGWGKLSYSGESSPHLQIVILEYFNEDECSKHYSDVSKRFLSNGLDFKRQICAGGRTNISDTCQGDSGGPLLRSNDNFNVVHNILGITSFGKGCGIQNLPAVYTKVSAYVSWIEDIVWPDQSFLLD